MDNLTAGRRWAALLALALGGFGLGLTEFVAMGLLPEIASDLLPAEYARSHEAAVASAGWMITIYALGVVIGAPTIAALTARIARRRLVISLLALMVVGTAASALAPTFELVLAGRFVAALAHGAYFGAAGILAASILGPGNQGKGVAMVIGGLTAANLLGVPLITALGQAQGWRAGYLAVAAVFALTLVAVAVTVPAVAAAPGGSPAAELRAFRSPQVWLVAATVAVGTSGFFAVNSYVAPVTTQITGLSSGMVPWVMAVMGLGMTAGIAIGGIAADWNLRTTVLIGFVAMLISVIVFALTAAHPAGLFIGAFLTGAASLFIVPALQALLIAAAPDAQLMGAAVNQSSLNIANSIGAALGGAAIAAGWGYLSSAWLGVALTVAGLVLAVISFRTKTPTHQDHREPVTV
ncbi:DHA1 family inner membrane transport protein [Actinoplanes lutulentus]|uniref:DHA1 family inner membrane transport protein n=1 Tax=Actinoplanes lutulentus TaxID=1287878 RepID=A0A327Z2E6_9ACTN|nr:MFS transporter [Actinoplanes lutulentus]MBB2940370.1 DHA1 family inner membrane transport protein [Actinoplanes lutulentus]RAK28863.1 DHA1 family inner membrane transport protein [Actinoplanes lutulentus]